MAPSDDESSDYRRYPCGTMPPTVHRQPASGLRAMIVLVAALGVSLPTSARADPPAPGESAAELTRQGQAHVHEGNDGLAVRRFIEAITIDPTHGPAYLALAAARERAGDLAEAERTYDLALEHIPNFAAAYRARAALKRRMGEPQGEITDLEMVAAIAESPESLRALAARYVEDKSWPAALATWRRIAALETTRADDRARREAMMKVRALTVLCAELDPVTGDVARRGWMRRALASMARRR
jgi:tetratricopeptide (TPR) repeat protein